MQLIVLIIALVVCSAAAWDYSKEQGFTASSCEASTSESKCTADSSCSWCTSAAVGDSCMSASDAAGVPSSIFTCSAAKAEVKAVAGKEFACGDHNNDCLGCIQMSDNVVSQCTYCPVDQVCHTVGSLFNKCTNDECISLVKTSTCKNKTAADCDNVASYKGLANKASKCEDITSESSCSSASCAWCESAAVGNSCMDASDAKDLPAAVFTCTLPKALKASSCEASTSESKCTADSSCSWCTSAAVGDSCMDASDAKDLPAAVFTCSAAKAAYGANKKVGDPALPTLPAQYMQAGSFAEIKTNAGYPNHVTEEMSASYYDEVLQKTRTDVKSSSYGEPGPYTTISDYTELFSNDCSSPFYEDVQAPREYLIVGDTCCYSNLIQDCDKNPETIPAASKMYPPAMPTKIEFLGSSEYPIVEGTKTDLWENAIWLGQEKPVILNDFYFDSADHETQLANFLNINAGPQYVNATTTFTGKWTLGAQDPSLFDLSKYDCSKLCNGASADTLYGRNPLRRARDIKKSQAKEMEVIQEDTKCCNTCPTSTDKYYSTPMLQKHNCGESCIAPSDYDKFKLFEPGLTKAETAHPCQDKGFLTYDHTETHGAGPIKVTVDFYVNNA